MAFDSNLHISLKNIIQMFTVSKFYKNLVKWALTEMDGSVAGTKTLNRE